MSSTAYHLHGDALSGSVVWTCEHASGAAPADWPLSDSDARWCTTHWGHDRGAAPLVRALQQRLGGPAIYGAHSRLLVDLNRAPDDPELCRDRVEGQPFPPNTGLTVDQREQRLQRYYHPYHEALDRLLTERTTAGVPTLLFSVHTFTALYEGRPRTLDAGVLFDETDSGAAALLLDGLRSRSSAVVEANAPWSGLLGLIYSVARHGAVHRVPYLELEVRDDLLVGPEPRDWRAPIPVRPAGLKWWADAVSEALRPVLDHFARPGGGGDLLQARV